MTKINTATRAHANASIAADMSLPFAQRQNGWNTLQEIKRRAKTSYAKLLVTDQLLEQIKVSLATPDPVVEEAPVRGRKVSAVREYALSILNDLPVGATRFDKIEALMVRMSITKYNAMYYVDRVAKSA